MSAERLTTLASVKEWLGVEGSDSDEGLLRVIDAASRFTLNYLGRETLLRKTYSQKWLGGGKNSAMLGNWPILSITDVRIGAASIPASSFNDSGYSSGWSLSDERTGYRMMDLYGYVFSRGIYSQVTYEAGFELTETSSIPATPHQYQTSQLWTVDRGVLINGTEATKVDSGPTAGQYSVSAEGVYTFAAADAGLDATITYGYVPADISFAVTELVGEWYKRKDRIGVLSKTLGGQETVTFNNQSMTSVAMTALQPYRNVIPI